MDYKDHQSGVTGDLFWFRAKKDLLEMLLERALPDQDVDRRILSVGCGVGYDLELMRRFGKVYVMDTERRALDLIPDGLVADKRVGDICHGGYEDGFFDLVVAMDLLEHIHDDGLAIREILRMLRPGGAMILTVPAFPFLYSGHDRELGHVRRYTKKTIRRLLEPAFRLERINFWTSLLFPPLAVQRLAERNSSDSALKETRLPRPVNELFYRVMRLEHILLRMGFPLPFGTSIYAVCRKD